MNTLKEVIQSTEKNFTHIHAGIDKVAFTQKVHELLQSHGYTLIQGNDANGMYEKGNRVLRILLGAFIQYFKFQIKTVENAEHLEVTVSRETSGMSGGLVGMNQVKKEMQAIEETFKNL
ncbi:MULTISPECIES: hypothetical protein [Aquimarina]|uniref:hypothetical protein n=1 Tax=Aquimarina TaxID=290174 RepID=UPI000D694F67|nr:MULTISPECIES: hypothetical protein [Aquimarina]